MAATRQAQILLEPEEYDRLEALARQQGATLSDLLRDAVRERYRLRQSDRERILEEIFQLQIPVGDWEDIEEEIERGHVDGLP